MNDLNQMEEKLKEKKEAKPSSHSPVYITPGLLFQKKPYKTVLFVGKCLNIRNRDQQYMYFEKTKLSLFTLFPIHQGKKKSQ